MPRTKKIAEETKPTSLSTEGIDQLEKVVPVKPKKDDIIEYPVVAIEKDALFVDITPYGVGLIYGLEFINARDVIKKINIGDIIKAKVVEEENEDGYIELSLKEAKQAIVWSEAEELMRQKSIIELTVKEANKGGLIMSWQGIDGFLPASQLKTDHYPRVVDGDKEKILRELKKLVGKSLPVSIITALAKEGKLIFSEKEVDEKDKEVILGKYELGDEVDGLVTGIVDFGIFVKLEEGLEGLVHISEIDWGLVDDPHAFVRVGEKIKAKVIEIKEGKISLSIKALKQNPWQEAGEKYKKGDKVSGIVIKFNKHGALVSIEEGVAGLVHISEFGGDTSMKSSLSLGKSYPFTITLFEPKEHRMTLSFLEKAEKAGAKKEVE